MVLCWGTWMLRLSPPLPSTFLCVSSLGKASDWQYCKAKLSHFLLHRREIRNQTSINCADRLPERRHTVQFESWKSLRRVLTRGTRKRHLSPWLSCSQSNGAGRRTASTSQDHIMSPSAEQHQALQLQHLRRAKLLCQAWSRPQAEAITSHKDPSVPGDRWHWGNTEKL